MKQVEIKDAPTSEIDWSIPQYVIVPESKIIILTTGETDGNNYTGFALPCEIYPKGEYCSGWLKLAAKLFTGKANLEISND